MMSRGSDDSGELVNTGRYIRVATALVLVGATQGGTPVMAQQFSAGYEALRIVDPAADRPIHLDVWFPVAGQQEEPHDYGFSLGSVVLGGSVAGDALPVVLLSPGAMGSASNYSWIGQALARHGYIVLGVSHFGESMVFGEDSIDPTSVARFGDRTRDLNFALDYFFTGSSYADTVDPDRLGAVGHSSGGASIIMLAGGQFDAESLAAHCATGAAATDKGCWFPVGGPDELGAQRPVPSTRPIRTLVVLDPAVGPGFDASSLQPVAAPTLVIGSVQNDFLPHAYHAGRYAELLPDAEAVELDTGEGHFVYLDECGLPIKVMGVPLCADREGVVRAEVHERLVPIIESFLSRHLGARAR